MPIIIPRYCDQAMSFPEHELWGWAIDGSTDPNGETVKLPFDVQGDSMVIKQGDLAQFIRKLQPERR